jgi:type IV secretion system protein VirB5
MSMGRIQLLAAAGLAALALSASSAHAQMAVYDATSYAKLIQQAQTALSQLHQAETQVQQGEQLLQSFNQGSNVGALAQSLEAPALRQLLPGVPALMAAAQGDLTGLGAIGTQAAAIRSANRLYTPPAGDALAGDLEAMGLRAARDLALGQAVATGGQQRLTGLQSLQVSIDAAPNARAVLDGDQAVPLVEEEHPELFPRRAHQGRAEIAVQGGGRAQHVAVAQRPLKLPARKLLSQLHARGGVWPGHAGEVRGRGAHHLREGAEGGEQRRGCGGVQAAKQLKAVDVVQGERAKFEQPRLKFAASGPRRRAPRGMEPCLGFRDAGGRGHGGRSG